MLSALLATVCFRVAVQAENKHQVRLDDLESLLGDEYPQQLSPDGEWLAFTTKGELWVVATRSGSVRRRIGQGTLPAWSPDGTRLSYYSNTGGTCQLWVINIKNRRAEQVTNFPGGINPDPKTQVLGFVWDPMTYSWSPDGTKLVFASRVVGQRGLKLRPDHAVSPQDIEQPLILDAKTPPEWTISGIYVKAFPAADPNAHFWEKEAKNDARLPEDMVNQLFVVDLRTKITTQLTHGDVSFFDPSWSPDGGRLASVSNEGRRSNYGNLATNIYLIDIRSGVPTVLTSNLDSKWMPSWSPDGKYIAYAEAKGLGMRSVSVVPAGGGDPKRVTSMLDRSVLRYKWFTNNQSIVVIYVDGVDRPIARIDVATEEFCIISGQESASRSSLAVSASGVIAWQQDDPSDPLSIRVLFQEEAVPRVVVNLNPQVQSWAWGDQEVVHWKNDRGDDVDGILIKPV